MNDPIAIGAIICFAGAFIAGAIGYSKNPTTGTFFGFFLFGALLPLIGIVFALLSKGPVPPPQPPGWYADPWGLVRLRWYDGAEWTWHTA